MYSKISQTTLSSFGPPYLLYFLLSLSQCEEIWRNKTKDGVPRFGQFVVSPFFQITESLYISHFSIIYCSSFPFEFCSHYLLCASFWLVFFIFSKLLEFEFEDYIILHILIISIWNFIVRTHQSMTYLEIQPSLKNIWMRDSTMLSFYMVPFVLNVK